MAKDLRRLLLVPIDGSDQALKSLDYVAWFFEQHYPIDLKLVYVLPASPEFLVKESLRDRDTAAMLDKLERKHNQSALTAIEKAQKRLKHLAIDPQRITTLVHRQVPGIAAGICNCAETQMVDAIVIASHGKTRLESLFVGSTATKVAELNTACPVWLIKESVHEKNVLIAVDGSENSQRAVDHAGFILEESSHKIVLYHSIQSLLRRVPTEICAAEPGLEALCNEKGASLIKPFMEKARKKLTQNGVSENRVRVKVDAGSRKTAKDILNVAHQESCGTVVLGRRGTSEGPRTSMGSVTRDIFRESRDLAIWIVP